MSERGEESPSGRLAGAKVARGSLVRRCFRLLAVLTLLAVAITAGVALAILYLDGTDAGALI